MDELICITTQYAGLNKEGRGVLGTCLVCATPSLVLEIPVTELGLILQRLPHLPFTTPLRYH